MQATQPRILVSLSAQKAATTWLAQYLSEHPQCARPPLKETHYFDYHDLGTMEKGRVAVARLRSRLVERGQADPAFLTSRNYRRALTYMDRRLAAFDAGPPTYDGYEDLLLSAARKTTKIIGDITPANGLLSVARLRNIVALPSCPLFMFIMRDPVDRAWSSIRFMARVQAKHPAEYADRARQILAETLATDDGPVNIRNDYGTMLRKFDETIPAQRIFIDFFENFLRQERIDALCDFLGVDRCAAALEKPQFAGTPVAMTAAEKHALSAKLRPVYDAVENRMGRLPARWVANRDVASAGKSDMMGQPGGQHHDRTIGKEMANDGR